MAVVTSAHVSSLSVDINRDLDKGPILKQLCYNFFII